MYYILHCLTILCVLTLFITLKRFYLHLIENICFIKHLYRIIVPLSLTSKSNYYESNKN